jgi:hypothetical protein
MKKYFQSIFLCVGAFLFFTAAFADCDHCFSMFKVELVYKAGTKKTVYMPIYGGDVEASFWENKFKNGQNILKHFNKNSWQYYHRYSVTIYEFNMIGNLFCYEEIDSFKLSEMKYILFINKYVKMGGAGNVPSLKKEEINRILSERIISVGSVEGSCGGIFYINFDSTITDKEFKLFLRYAPGAERRDFFYQLQELLNYQNTKPLQIDDPVSDIFVSVLDSAIAQLTADIDSINGEYSNLSMLNYFSSLKEYLINKKQLIECTKKYIINKDQTILTEYIVSIVVLQHKRSEILNKIEIAKSDNEKIRIFFNEMFGHVLRRKNMTDLFNSVVINNKFIHYDYSWD